MTDIISNISVDCVIFGFDGTRLNVLLIERELNENGKVVFKDHTLTGYHIERSQNLHDAAKSILLERTGLKNIYLQQVFTFGDTDRLQNEKDRQWIKHLNLQIDERTITVAYFALVDSAKITPDKKLKAAWFPTKEIPELGFDHKQIIDKAQEMLRMKAGTEPILFELLPDKFTLSELQKVYEAVYDTTLDRRNFRKKVLQMKFIIPLDEKQTGVAHKPAQLHLFSREVYEKTRKERFVITI